MHEIDKAQFGAFVARLRKEQGLTQKELADLLYISNKAVSKWETGVSIPDVQLLIPLSQALGVSVTELLECRKIPTVEPQVEQLVQKAIRYGDEEPADEKRGKRFRIYLVCLATAGLELLALHLGGQPCGTWSDILLLSVFFGVLCGGYFMLLAKPRLPRYHDENRIGGTLQGVFRIQLPGIAFNNRNWPHMLRVGRLWSMVFLVAYPAVYFVLMTLAPEFWREYEEPVMLVVLLGTLFVPLYYVGKKYE